MPFLLPLQPAAFPGRRCEGTGQAGVGASRALLHLLPAAVPGEASSGRAAVRWQSRVGSPLARMLPARRTPGAVSAPARELWAELGNVRNPPLHTALSASSCFEQG